MKRDYSDSEASITLQALIDNTAADKLIPQASRRNRLSHLRTVARVIGKPPNAIAGDVSTLRAELTLANPGPAGLSTEYWGMCRSTVWWALERAGVTVIRATGTELSAELARAVKPLPQRPHRLTLAPLLKYWMEYDLNYLAFDQDSADSFRDWMKTGYRKRAWQKPYRRAIEMFMQCGREYPDLWPQTQIQVQFDNDHYTPGWSAFPELEVEVDRMFNLLMQPPNRRSQHKKQIRESTARARKYYVLRAASAIALANHLPFSSIRRLSQVIHPEGVETFVDFVVTRRNGADRTGDLSQACGAFNAIARHWLKLDKDTIAELVNIRRSVMPREGPAEKNKRLMEDFRSLQMRKAFLRNL